MLKKLIYWVVELFKKKPPHYPRIPKEIRGQHDCALRALHVTLPDLSVAEMITAFNDCCGWWPHEGVYNKEFNIVLAYLKVKDKFHYVASESITLGHLLNRKKDTFIVLMHGHYTVVSKGFVLDDVNCQMKDEVCCYWLLK